MSWVATAVAMCLGVLIGALVAWVFNHKKQITYSSVVVSVVLLFGCTMLPMFYSLAMTAEVSPQYWLYVMGLCLGVGGTTALAIRRWGYDS